MPDSLTPTERAIQNRGKTMYNNGQPVSVSDDLWDDLPEETQQAIAALPGVRFSITGMVIDTNLDNNEWLNLLNTIEAIRGAYQWILGDWIRYGVQRKYGKTGKRMAVVTEITGKDYNTLQDYYNTARLFEFLERSKNCNFEIHRVIARAYPDDTPEHKAERLRWLKVAESEGLSGKKLYNRIYEIEDGDSSTLLERVKKQLTPKMAVWNKPSVNRDVKKSLAAYLRECADELDPEE